MDSQIPLPDADLPACVESYSSCPGNAAKTSKQVAHRDRSSRKPQGRGLKYWYYKETHKYDNDIEYRRALGVFCAIKEIPSMKLVIMQLVRTDPEERTITVSRHRMLHWRIHECVGKENMDVDTIKRLKEQLWNYVDLLWDHGVGFPVTYNAISLNRFQKVDEPDSFPWMFFLYGLERGVFWCPRATRERVSWWWEQKEKQLDNVERIFKPLIEQAMAEGADKASLDEESSDTT